MNSQEKFRIYAKEPSIKTQSMNDGLIVHIPASGNIHILNGNAHRVFEFCDGKHSVSEIVHSFVNEFGISQETAEADINAIITEFLSLEFIAEIPTK